MKVPLLDVKAQNGPLEEELKAAFERVLRSGCYILGPEVEELEKRVAEMAEARHGIGVSSGTDALLLALMVLGVGSGDEVLCPAFTFFATAGCIARTGATPVFVDSLEDTFNIDVRDAARKVTARTKAIMPVHLFGQAADMDGVMALAQDHALHVIEDGAQALGARHRERPVGGIGTFGTFSFFPSKNLGGFGDGGMLVCNDDELAARARILRAHGASPKYYHKYIGGNFRLDPLQAALIRVKLPHYATYTRKRQENAAYYTQNLAAFSSVAGAGKLALVPPANGQGDGHIWNQYTLRVPGEGRRSELRRHLADNGIASEIYYPVPMDAQECFRHLEQQGGCPVAARLAGEVLSLPIYPEMRPSQCADVIGALGLFSTAGSLLASS
jgi:dTDP-4-amino-4,6-dideoxygalactose transaminase